MKSVGGSVSPLEAVEVSLRRLRLVGAVVVLGAGLSQRGSGAGSWGSVSVVGLAIALVAANAASKRMAVPDANIDRLVLLQLGVDLAVTTGVILLFAPEPSGMAWVIIGLPVLEGAMRFRMVGAVGTWFAMACVLCLHTILTSTSGPLLRALLELAQPLSLGLALGVPAGYLADHLTAELLHAARQNEDMQRRARQLAVLTVAGRDFAGGTQREIMEAAVEAARELGYEFVDIGAFDNDTQEWSRTYAQSKLEVDLRRTTALEAEAARLGVGFSQGAADRIVSVVAHDKSRVLMLRGFLTKDDSPWPPRDEAFVVLAANAATAMATAIRQERLIAGQRRLRHDATHDQLTGLLNRAGLLSELAAALETVQDELSACAVLFLDLDRFKQINDTHGHDAGDHVLKQVASRLQAHSPEGASVARIGGDEFVVAISAASHLDVSELSDRLDRVIAEPIELAEQYVCVGSSTGIHVVRRPDVSAADALRCADQAMYEHKRSRTLEDRSAIQVAEV